MDTLRPRQVCAALLSALQAAEGRRRSRKRDQTPDAIGLSILSGAHMTQFARVLELLKERGASDIVVFGGGIVPAADIAELERMGVAKIFTPGAPTHEIVDWVKSTLGGRTSQEAAVQQ